MTATTSFILPAIRICSPAATETTRCAPTEPATTCTATPEMTRSRPLGGSNRLFGGTGNDAYFVDNTGNGVIESVGGGIDTVYATAHSRLADNVENLVLQGSADLQAYGNGGSNAIYGNAGNNILDGGIGVDGLYGLGWKRRLISSTTPAMR